MLRPSEETEFVPTALDVSFSPGRGETLVALSPYPLIPLFLPPTVFQPACRRVR